MANGEGKDAQLHRILGSPARLRILRNLLGKEVSVGTLAASAHLSVPNTSQHLRLMHDKGLLTSRRQGQSVYYRIADTEAIKRCLSLGRMGTASKRRIPTPKKERSHEHNI